MKNAVDEITRLDEYIASDAFGDALASDDPDTREQAAAKYKQLIEQITYYSDLIAARKPWPEQFATKLEEMAASGASEMEMLAALHAHYLEQSAIARAADEVAS